MISGGVAPFFYVWADPAAETVTETGNTLTRTGVSEGIYVVYVIDSSATASFKTAVPFLFDVVAGIVAPHMFRIAGLAVEPPVGCGVQSLSCIWIELDTNAAPGGRLVGAWNVNASDTPITACNDTRMVAGAPVGNLLNLTVSHGRWTVAVCVGGLLQHSPQLDTQPDNVPLVITAVASGQTCHLQPPWVLKAPATVSVYLGVGLVEPFSIVDTGNKNLAEEGDATFIFNATEDAVTNLTVSLPGLAVAGVYSLWVADGHGCGALATVMVADTGAAPCGTCFVNNTACYGCDGVPNSGLVYDVCGVCNGTAACLVACTITQMTNVAFAPDEIRACVAAGKKVTGINPPLILLSVDIPPAPHVDIEFVRMTDFTLHDTGNAYLIGLTVVNMDLDGVKFAACIGCTLTAGLQLEGRTTHGDDPALADVRTFNLQQSTIAGVDIQTTNADDAQHLILNIESLQGGDPRSLQNTGSLTVVLIQSGITELLLVATVDGAMVTFMNDHYLTSSVGFLNISIVGGSVEDVGTLACAYVTQFPLIILRAGGAGGAVNVTTGSDQCTENGFSAGGPPPPPQPPNGTSWVFLFGVTSVIIGVTALFGLVYVLQ
jgi:hypothetical protein